MGYRNKTYVIFDGDEDMWAYAYMKGWKKSENVDFDFHDAHDLNVIRDGSNEETVKKKLRERFAGTKQAIVIVGEKTKNLFRFVRWEIETCHDLKIPIVVVNLNNKKEMDQERCPPILRDTCAVHVPFRAKAIKYALDDFYTHHASYASKGYTNIFYPQKIYDQLGLE